MTYAYSVTCIIVLDIFNNKVTFFVLGIFDRNLAVE